MRVACMSFVRPVYVVCMLRFSGVVCCLCFGYVVCEYVCTYVLSILWYEVCMLCVWRVCM